MHHNLRTLDLNLLLVFDAVYRHQSVARAAEELALSNSALSHALARLRRHLGDELFYRVGHEMQPTLFASALADSVHNSLGMLNQMVKGVSLDIENYCTLRLFFNHSDVGSPLCERVLIS